MAETVVRTPYGSISVQVGFRPDPIERTTWLITGPVKSTKTSFLASVDDILIVDAEDKARYVDGGVAAYFVPRKLPEVDGLIEQLVKDGPVKAPWKMIGFDTSVELQDGIIIPGLTKEIRDGHPDFHGEIMDWRASEQGSTGWRMVAQRMLKWLTLLRQAGFGWIVADHTTEDRRTVKQGGKDLEVVKIRPASIPGLYKGMYRQALFLGSVGFSTTTEKVTESRTIHLPDGTAKVVDVRSDRTEKVVALSLKRGGDTTGCNVAMPDRIVLPKGQAWATVKELYSAAIRR